MNKDKKMPEMVTKRAKPERPATLPVSVHIQNERKRMINEIILTNTDLPLGLETSNASKTGHG
jgi:hypothetical protein